MLHLLCVDLVVFHMRTDKPHIDHPIWIIDTHHEPIVIALDVENSSVIP
jgi:hypothetical protein